MPIFFENYVITRTGTKVEFSRLMDKLMNITQRFIQYFRFAEVRASSRGWTDEICTYILD